jgi:membrane fusion protein, heavy metal efflux system
MHFTGLGPMDAVRKLLVALIGSAAILVGCSSAPGPSSTASEAAPIQPMVKFDPDTLARLGVRTAPAGQDSLEHRLQVPGTVEYASDRYAEVGTIQEGRISRVNVKVGDPVKKGQVLATLLVPAIASAQADALSAQAALKVARDHARREALLLERSLTTARESELAAGDVTAREAEFAAASARLKLFGASVPTTDAAIRPDGTISLVSPIDGTVVSRMAVLGSYLEPSETAFAVADTTSLWGALDIFESDLPYITIGAKVDITTESLPGKVFHGQIEMLEPQLGRGTRASRARVVLPNPDGQLRAGLFLRASVEIKPPAASEGRLLVPGASVQPLADRDVVFVQRQSGEFEVRTVSVARRTSQLAEISDGVRPGEQIVVHGAFILRGEVTKQ